MKPIATEVNTDTWNHIIRSLLKEDWKIKIKYDAFDAGIDFDYIELEKNGKIIQFGWSNWEEGEIKCSKELMDTLQSKFSIDFQFGVPMNLKQSIIILTKSQIWVSNLIK